MEDGDQIIPFVRCFYGSPSTFLWEDDGRPRNPTKGSLGQQAALEAIKQCLRDDEKLFAFLDDLKVVCRRDRVADVMNSSPKNCRPTSASTTERHKCGTEGALNLRDQARKIGEKSCSGVEGRPHPPTGTAGDPSWGHQLGQWSMFGASWNRSQANKRPFPPDSICAGHPGVLVVAVDVRGNTSQFLDAHGATGPGPELCGATTRMFGSVYVPFWASKQHRIWPRFCPTYRCLEADWGSVALPWAGCVHMVKQRHPEVAESLLMVIDQDLASCFLAVRDCADSLREAGLDMPTWRILANTPPARDHQAEPADTKFGWQHRGGSCGGAVLVHTGMADVDRRSLTTWSFGIGNFDRVSNQPCHPD